MNTVLIDRRLLTATLMFLLVAGSLTGCNTPKEQALGGCTSDEECEAEETCLNQGCQPLQCESDEIVCERRCVNPNTVLEFCGGCGGCPEMTNAQGERCTDGQCIYRCLDGFVDVNDDINDPNGDGCECVPDGPEVCDGVDNDCDGLVDAMDDELEPCDAEDGAEAACVAGICEQACIPGLVDVNEDLGMGGNGCECEPTGDEICDGIDNDCDGLTDIEDEDLEVGDEVCDGQDNDCDGDIDEDDDDFVVPQCQLTAGVCEGLQSSCVDGIAQECSNEEFASHASSNDQQYQITETLCDEQDNNCDGRVDELCCDSQQDLSILETSDDGGFELIDMVTNQAGTQAAVLVIKNSSVGVALIDQDLTLSFSNYSLGSIEEGSPASIHWSEEGQRYEIVYQDGEALALHFVEQEGRLGLSRTVTLQQTYSKFKSFGITGGRLVVAGINESETHALTHLINANNGTTLDEDTETIVNPLGIDSISNVVQRSNSQHDLAISFRQPGPFESRGTHKIFWLKVRWVGNLVDFVPARTLDRVVLNPLGAGSSETFLLDDKLYQIQQTEEGTFFGLTRQDSSNEFEELFTLGTQSTGPPFLIRHVHNDGDFIHAHIDTADGFAPILFNTSNNRAISPGLETFTQPHQKRTVRMALGTLTVISSSDFDNQGSLSAVLFNEENELLCP